MKIRNKVVLALSGLIILGTSLKAQSLDDSKKAVYAEQFQKAKAMFKNLTTTQPSNAENYFYYGDLYLNITNPDSAKIMFQKGITADP